ncbi:MAG: hypothetical protein COU29_03485 [Candidatus Magasanikbacteria bacterium CG10_big_fil_rev_8_21_14_0_10_36_32]|uniref:Uncharacterized protein n=1 Tax=Candidatus Magasanikbacteria bacterium CG10_big_fil_rev_8_21_14_0_10_36_32 TaxID=1974646 RepID=A0A2M6W5G3_9BACT|nr:MAG: hypothetical protein COU29_03485 [Candidatus Magasanikbacteria bacterium CG10_big_fil_rev_8_21_14_0_10_36_32]
MFGKKEQIAKSVSPSLTIPVNTIPDDFYAGANPVVQFKEVAKTVELNKNNRSILSAEEKKAYDKTTTAGSAQKFHPANLLSSRKFLIIGGVILFVVMIVGTGLYYWWQAKTIAPQSQEIIIVPTQTQTSEISVPTIPTESAVTTPIEEVIPEETPIMPVAAMDFPSVLLGESSDMDHDNVSDVAEELFGIDPFNSDSDNDKYPDGHELYYLYNPAGFEPKKIVDSGFVKEFRNPTYGFKLYYPTNWVVGNVDPIYQQTLFSTLTGENIEAHVFNLESGQTLADWLSVSAPQEKLSDLSDFAGYFDTVGKRRNDGLVYYFQNGQRLYVLAYHTTNSSVVNYKIVLEIMARSFQFGEVNQSASEVVNSPMSQMPEVMSGILENESADLMELGDEMMNENESPVSL